jgi:2-phosphosulfolactate phosphatase
MKAEVFLSSLDVTEDDVKDRTVIVIDVLRACSTIATALLNGARSFIPVADMAQASKLASALDPSTFLLGGERDGNRIPGYHLGNSPLEYSPDIVKGRTIIFNTTNGTVAMARARSARYLVTGSFLNAARVVEFVRDAGLDVTIICAGWRNRVSLEDTMLAGLLLYRLWNGREPGLVSDASHIAFTQYRNDKDQLEATLRRCNHAQWLTRNGYGADVDYCLRVDALSVLPYYEDSRLVLYQEARHETAA